MDIFISYSRTDAVDIVESLHAWLEDLGHDAFVDLKGIGVGERWGESINNHILSCQIFIIVITPSAMRSRNMEMELKSARKEGKRIIPCFYKNVRNEDIPWDLSGIQGVRFENIYQLLRNLTDMFNQAVEINIVTNPINPINTSPLTEHSSIFGLNPGMTEWWICQVCNAKFPTYNDYSEHFSSTHR